VSSIPQTIEGVVKEAKAYLRDLEIPTSRNWMAEGGYGFGIQPDIQARSVARRVDDLARANELSSEDCYALMAAEMAKVVISTTKMYLEQSNRMLPPIFMGPTSCCHTPNFNDGRENVCTLCYLIREATKSGVSNG
jgi:hypothetical protein